jgi:uncharacterized DUF497 family protein
MRVTWDPNKARVNLKKHGIRFSDAEAVLFDPLGITVEDVSSRGEPRFITIGTDPLGQVLVVVYAYRETHVRLISARRATRKERHRYEEGV